MGGETHCPLGLVEINHWHAPEFAAIDRGCIVLPVAVMAPIAADQIEDVTITTESLRGNRS